MKPRSKCIMRTARWVIVGVVPVDLKTLLKRALEEEKVGVSGFRYGSIWVTELDYLRLFLCHFHKHL